MKKFKLMVTAAAAAVAVTAMISISACSGGNTTANTSVDTGENNDTKQIKIAGRKYEIKSSDYLSSRYDELADGKDLKLSIDDIPQQGNPFHQDSSLYTMTLWYWYNPQLILFDAKAKAYPNPEYLISMNDEVKEGKTIVTYVINPKAHYNNGEPIDWKSFATTWKINNGQDKAYSPNSTDGYRNIESVTAGKNEREVIVTFKRVYPWWQGLFNMIANPKLADPNFYQNGYLRKLHPELGAGPYTVNAIDFDKKIVIFSPNEKWWGNKGKLTKVIYTAMENSSATEAFTTGAIDALDATSKESQAKLKDRTDISIYNAMLPNSAALILNAKSANLKDIKVREAIWNAIDRTKITQIRFQNINIPDKDGKLTIPFQELSLGSFLMSPFQKEYWNNFGAVVKYDPKKSEALFEEAGWKRGTDGIRENNGRKLELRMPLLGDNPTALAMARAYQAMLKQVGVQINIEQHSANDFNHIYTNRDFDIFSVGFASSNPFGIAYFKQIYGSDSAVNLSGTGTLEFDQKIEELQKIPDPDELLKKTNELEREAFQLYGIMPLYKGPSLVATKKGLANLGAMGFTTVPKELIGWRK